MKTLNVRVKSLENIKADILKAVKDAESEKPVKARYGLSFPSYDLLHRVLAPARLNIVKALAGQEPMSVREVARLVERDVKGVHTDLTMLINAGVIERTEDGVSFPYDRIHLEVDIDAAA